MLSKITKYFFHSCFPVYLLVSFLLPGTALADDWPQDAHDPQHTGVTPEEPSTPWTYQWMWSSGQPTAPDEARLITGGNLVYIPAGNLGLYALNLANGSQVWRFSSASVNAAAVYDPAAGSIYVGGSNGTLYKLNAANGSQQGTYSAGSPINKSLVLANGSIYLVTDNGQLHKIRASDMTRVWVYSANSQGSTPPAYSASKQLLVFATADLYVHAVRDANGAQAWRTKPTRSDITPGFPNTFDKGWPVIADRHGVVFVRMQLIHSTMTDWNLSLNSNSAIRDFLSGTPRENLFALDLDTGAKKFIPAVGYGTVEDHINGAPYGVMGTQPIIKVYPNGHEVAYMPFRSYRANTDYRWNGYMGEMVLDGSTISGLQAGDLRFIQMSNFSGEGGTAFVHIIDEQLPITMAGNTLFHAHWGGSESVAIRDRSSGLGLTSATPIDTDNRPIVVRTAQDNGSLSSNHSFSASWMSMYSDGRTWPGPGFWVYRDRVDPAGAPQSAGYRPLYTVVSNGYVLVEGNGGDLFVLKHSGPSTVSPVPTTVVPSATPAANKIGDADGDGDVDGVDFTRWLNHYDTRHTNGPSWGDFDNSGLTDGIDFTLWLNRYEL